MKRIILFLALLVPLTGWGDKPAVSLATPLSVDANGNVLPVSTYGKPLNLPVNAERAGHQLERYSYRDIAALATDEVDKRVAGVTAGTATQNLFSTRTNTGGGTYVRNASLFAKDVDFTCESVWNSSASPLQTATAISPRHVLLANHYYPATGTTFRWVTATGAVVERTLSSSAQIGSTDIRIGYLSSDLPATITPAEVLSVGAESKLEGHPIVFIDQNQEAFIGDVTSVMASVANTTGITASQSSDSTRASFWKTPISGDSSHPVFALLDGKPDLLGSFYSSFGVPSLAQNIASINSAMTSLGGSYQLIVVTLEVLSNAATITASVTPNAGQIPLVNEAGKLDLSVIPVSNFSQLYDSEATPKLSIDGITRSLYADDGSTEVLTWATPTSANFFGSEVVITSSGIILGQKLSLGDTMVVSAPADYTVRMENADGIAAVLDNSLLTADRVQKFPNKAGTFAMTNDLGTAASQNTGTSGANVPLLNGVNSWSGAQTFAGGIKSSDGTSGASAITGGITFKDGLYTSGSITGGGGSGNVTGPGSSTVGHVATFNATDGTALADSGLTLSGSNTGDETTATIKTKLSITTLSGSNTGDQDLSGYAAKNSANTAGSSFTLDLGAASVTAGLKLPSATGAAPTADGFLAFDTTGHDLKYGSNGTTRTVANLAGTQAFTHKDLTDATNMFPTFNQNTTGSAGSMSLSGGGTVTGSSGAVTVVAGGTNQNITLTPSGTGNIQSVNGSASSPTYSFSSLTNTGLYTLSSGLGFSTTGVLRLFITNTGLIQTRGNGLDLSAAGDTVLMRNVAGVAELNNGTAIGATISNARDLTLRTLYGPNPSGTNIAGGDLTLSGGLPTGNAAGGNILFAVSNAAGSSGTTQNTKQTVGELFLSGGLYIGTSPSDPGANNLTVKGNIAAAKVIGMTYAPPTAVSASDIDWSTSNSFTKTLGANTTFTFSNTVSGQTIVVGLTNTASNYTVTWPTVVWAGGTTPVQTTGAHTDIYTFIKLGSTIYGSAAQNF